MPFSSCGAALPLSFSKCRAIYYHLAVARYENRGPLLHPRVYRVYAIRRFLRFRTRNEDYQRHARHEYAIPALLSWARIYGRIIQLSGYKHPIYHPMRELIFNICKVAPRVKLAFARVRESRIWICMAAAIARIARIPTAESFIPQYPKVRHGKDRSSKSLAR